MAFTGRNAGVSTPPSPDQATQPSPLMPDASPKAAALGRRAVGQSKALQHSLPQSRSSSPLSRESSTSRSGSRVRHTSFSSIKEDNTVIAQTFVDSARPMPYIGDPTNPDLPPSKIAPPIIPDFCCPCGSFQGWKKIKLGGKRLSRSYTDLSLLGGGYQKGWAWDTTDLGEKHQPAVEEPSVGPRAGQSRLEQLPIEVLDNVLSFLILDVPPQNYSPRNQDLSACLLTSRTVHAATLSVLYRNVTIPHSIIFSKVLGLIQNYPALGTLVRRLDFSHYSSVGFGRTRQASSEIHNVTPRTLMDCLDLIPNLQEFLVHEHIDDELTEEVISKVLTMPSLRAVDFCACSSRPFTDAFSAVILNSYTLPELHKLKRVGLHECTTLDASVFEKLLPKLHNLTHLDVGHTLITDEALLSIPSTARLTHLNLGRCTRITGPKVVKFLTQHAAVKDSLVYLNLMTDISRYRLLTDADVGNLLPNLPTTLRSLNLTGAKVTSAHVPLLLPLTKYVEELGLGSAELSIDDINSFFVPRGSSNDVNEEITSEELNWVPSALKYLDLSSVPSITQAALFNSNCLLVSPHSYPLDVLELDSDIIKHLQKQTKSNAKVGWTIRELGRRGWYVRLPGKETGTDDGFRTWKMGCRWWGMRKVPVAVAEVGGMYGHYMFKK